MLTDYYVCCNVCRVDKMISAKPEDIRAWIDGKLIQDAMPYLDKADRELLVSRTCGECWHEMFGIEEEEDVCNA